MAELVVIGSPAADLRSDDPGVSMRFYCWPHRVVHEFDLKAVEKIAYALGAEAVTAYEAGFNDGGENYGEGERTRLPEDGPQCLRKVLRGADDIEVYAEHVEQGIECRERAL